MAKYPDTHNRFPVTPKAYPASPKAYPASVNSYPASGGGDVTAPSLVSVVTDAAGTTITLTYNEALDAGSQPATTAYTLAGTSSTVASLNVTGSTVVLTLNTAAYRHETITLTYVVPGANPVQDAAGNDAAAFAGQAVTNNIAARAADPVAIFSATTPFFYLVGDLGITVATGVSAWADQSGQGKDATQGTGTAQPALVAGGLNGHNTVLFDGGTDVLNFATLDLPAPGTTNIWFFAVLRQVTWTANDSIYGGGGTTTTRLRQGGAGTPNVGANNTTTGPDNNGMAVNTWVRLEHLFKNTVADYVKLGSVSATGTNTGNTNAALGAFCLGAHSTAAGGASNIEVLCFGALQAEPGAGPKALFDSWCQAFGGGTVGI